jgi:hypothetical protein
MDNKLQTVVRSIIDTWTTDQVNQMKEILESADKRASGHLIDGITKNMLLNSEGVYAIINIPSYGVFVDSGRSPVPEAGMVAGHNGKRGYSYVTGFPPVEAIEKWCALKGITDTSAPFLIGRKIAEKGIEPVPFLHVPYDNEGELRDQLAEAMSKEISTNIVESLKK